MLSLWGRESGIRLPQLTGGSGLSLEGVSSRIEEIFQRLTV